MATQTQRKFNERLERITSDIGKAAKSEGFREPMTTKTDENDFAAHADALCDVLFRYNVCHESGTASEIIPKISLNGYRKHPKSGSAFDVLFPDHPHQEAEGQVRHWQNAVVQIPLEVSFKSKIGQSADVGLIEYHEFCGTISQRNQEQLFLTVSKKNSKLCKTDTKGPAAERLWMWTADDSKSVPLRQLLSERKLLGQQPRHIKMKNILLYLLAKGVWQFYDSQLMPHEWTKDSVEFLFEHRQHDEASWTVGIFLNQPLVSARHCISAPDRNGTAKLSHGFPKIRELGIMLLEILLGQDIDGYRSEFPRYLTGGQPTVHTDLRIAKELYDSKVKKDHNLYKPVQDAIAVCLDGQNFATTPKNKGNPDHVRTTLYEKVVRPLESLLSVMYGDRRDDLDPLLVQHPDLAHVGLDIARSRIYRRCEWTEEEGGGLPDLETDSRVVTTPSHLSSNVWFERLDELNEVLRATRKTERDAEYEANKVKIAVLDTGISDGIVQKRDTKWYRDFVEEAHHKRQDSCGHGTNVVRLIGKVLEEPDIYVARVFETEEADDRTPARVAEAIDWAVGESVDIIVMALGFPDIHEGIRKAMRNAVRSNILMFAAAGNGGSHSPVVFPARTRYVTCVFATNPANKNSRAFNPPRMDGRENFAILGEGIDLSGEGKKLLMGTSFATAIAAGFAGSLLDFSRQPACREEGKTAFVIRDPDDMSKILTKLSEKYRDEGYDCIVPWHLLKLAGAASEDLSREERRRNLCDTMTRWIQE